MGVTDKPRIATALGKLAIALRDLRTIEDQDAAIANLVGVLRETFGPRQRAFILWLAWCSAEDQDIRRVVFAEIERQFNLEQGEG